MKRNINLVGLLIICILFISTTVFASPKGDLREIWENQTFGNARYHVTCDTKMALFGNVQNSSIIDIRRDPLFIRSEDSVTIFGKTDTATTYVVQEGNDLHIYMEKQSQAQDGTQNEWVRYDETLPNSDEKISDLLPTYDEIVRSVKLINEEDDSRIYHVIFDGRTMYKNLKKYCEKDDTASIEGNTDDVKKREAMRAFMKELLNTWKNTDAVTMMVMVKDHKIVGLQTELAPQMNAMIHVVAAALDADPKVEGVKMGAMAEAFLAIESMKLTISEVGEAECLAVPDEIVKTATVEKSTDAAEMITAAMSEKNKTEANEKSK